MAGICRFCASIRKLNLLTTIADENDEICEKSKLCCQLIIGFEDSLPRTVCDYCITSLHSSYEFYLQVHESQNVLQTFIETASNDDDGLEAFTGICDEFAECSTESLQTDNNLAEGTMSLNSNGTIEKENLQNQNLVLIETGTTTDNLNILISDDEDITLELMDEQFEEDWVEDAIVTDIENDDYSSLANNLFDISYWKSYSWLCHLCSFVGSSVKVLHDHAEIAHNLNNHQVKYKCADCQKTCGRYYSFLNHIRQLHHPCLYLRCDICDKDFENFEALKYHREEICTKTTDLPEFHLCVECGKMFATRHALLAHSRLQHQENALKFDCAICDKQFKTHGSLKTHQRVHSGERNYACQICNRAFRYKINLKVHLKTHTTFSPYECAVCKRRFKTPSNLSKHNLIHNNVKEFNCDYCDKMFRTKDEKLSHERTHTGEKPYKCEHCDRLFGYRSSLMTHLNIHTGVRPYECIDCNHHFSNWPNYNKHMKRVHALNTAKTNP